MTEAARQRAQKGADMAETGKVTVLCPLVSSCGWYKQFTGTKEEAVAVERAHWLRYHEGSDEE